MNRELLPRVAFLGATAVVAVTIAVAATASSELNAITIDNPIGLADPSQFPDRIGVVGPDGKDIICSDGRPLTVSKDEIFAPPVPPGRNQKSGASSLVPRCTSGGHKAVWVASP
jgi:hypothetical protein